MFIQDYFAKRGTNNEVYHNTKGDSGDFYYTKNINASNFAANYFKTTGNNHTLNYYKTLSVNNEDNYNAESKIFNRLELSFDALF